MLNNALKIKNKSFILEASVTQNELCTGKSLL